MIIKTSLLKKKNKNETNTYIDFICYSNFLYGIISIFASIYEGVNGDCKGGFGIFLL